MVKNVKIDSLEWFGIKNKSFYNQYGRCVNVSYGLLGGLVIDKVLFIVTKGLSSFIPPFAVMLMGRGKVLFNIRFEKKFNRTIERFLSHIVTK